MGGGRYLQQVQGFGRYNPSRTVWLKNERSGSKKPWVLTNSRVRHRLRYCIWTDRKKPERERKNLIRLGVSPGQAYAWSRTRMGGWAVAQSPILGTTITVSRLMQKGYEPMHSYYVRVSPQLNEPLYTRPVRTVV